VIESLDFNIPPNATTEGLPAHSRASRRTVTRFGTSLRIRHYMTSQLLCAVLVSTLIAFSAARADGSPLSRARTRAGYALAYDLQFADCYKTLAEAITADPLDPAPRRAIAAVTWIEILFTQGVATFEAFTGEISKGDVIRPTTPPLLVERFHRMIGEARRLAEQQLTHADDADTHYQVGATAALSALYSATVEGRTLGALTQGRRAVSAMGRARERDGGKRETALILGMSQYTISTMSWPVRTLARLSGLTGDRETGLALLKEAAIQGTETETDALLLLMIVDNREGRPTDALPRLAYLQRLHPRNRLLALNHAATALAAGQPHEAEQALSPGIAGHDWDAGPAVLGEIALWFAQRGTARARLRRDSEAAIDLQRGLLAEPRDWVRGRIHSQLGDLALTAGKRSQARQEFETALDFSERGGDRMAAKEARQKLSAVKR
jgi:tetratricopeptide (TPR) repeat protein